jgi:Tfp pilus assembly protein PilF
MQRAREKLKAGDYQGSRALCEEMLRTDPAYNEAKECLALANQGLKGKGLQ